MNVEISNNNDTVIIAPKEKIDFVVAPELEKIIAEQAKLSNKMIIDMSDVDYISSAGLRAILYADDLMEDKGGFALKNVDSSVKEILDISGFSNVITII